MSKIQLRQEILKIRNSLSLEEVENRSDKIINILITKFFSKVTDLENKKIALYLNIYNEVKTDQIIKYLSKIVKKGNIALPKINAYIGEMEFKSYQLNDQLEPNSKYQNIFEPKSSMPSLIPEIMLVPLVACDKYGNRIGMGGGFYDRKIAKLRELHKYIVVIGLAYSFQLVEKVEVEKHDQALDFIALEDRLVDCKSN